MWLNCHLQANQASPEDKSLFSTRCEKCTAKNVPCFSFKKCVQKQGEMALRNIKPCCYFCDINLPCILQFLQVAPLFVTNLSIGKEQYLKIGPQHVLGVLCLILFLSVGMLFLNISIWEMNCYKWKGRQVITIFKWNMYGKICLLILSLSLVIMKAFMQEGRIWAIPCYRLYIQRTNFWK